MAAVPLAAAEASAVAVRTYTYTWVARTVRNEVLSPVWAAFSVDKAEQEAKAFTVCLCRVCGERLRVSGVNSEGVAMISTSNLAKHLRDEHGNDPLGSYVISCLAQHDAKKKQGDIRDGTAAS